MTVSRAAGLAAMSVLLAGCIASAPTRIDKELQGVPIEEAGFIAGSVSQQISGDNLAPFNDQVVEIRARGSKHGLRMSFSTGLFETPVDFEDQDVRGAVFRVPLPPGDYDLVAVWFYWNNGSVEKRWYSEQPFALPVTVHKGRTTYIGEYRSMGIWGRNFVGLRLPAAGYFIVSDSSVRDLAVLEAREPGFDPAQADIGVPEIPPALYKLMRRAPAAAAATP